MRNALVAFTIPVLLSGEGVAAPSPLPTLLVESEGTCPSADAVRSGIRDLTPPERQESLPSGCRVFVADRGLRMSVSVTCEATGSEVSPDIERSYDDAARDCERRARFAAVLAVVTLMPPDIAGEPLADSEPRSEPVPPPTPVQTSTPPPAPNPVQTPPARRPVVGFQLGGRASGAPAVANGGAAVAAGANLTAEFGPGPLRVLVAISYEPEGELRLPRVRASLSRARLSTGLRRHARFHHFDLAIDTGFQLERTALRADSFVAHARAGFALGAGLGLFVRPFADAPLGPFIHAAAEVYPSPIQLRRAPEGSVGRLPYVWLGLSAGVALW